MDTDPRACRLTDDLTRRLFERYRSPDDLRKKTLALKRALTSLRNELGDLQKACLLDASELQTLADAFAVIDRWTGKAERAHKERARVAGVEQERVRARQAAALHSLRERLAANDFRRQIVVGDAIAAVTRHFGRGDWLHYLLESARLPRNTLRAIGNDISRRYADQLRELAERIDYREEPVADLVEQWLAKVAEAERPAQCAPVITELEQLIARAALEQANPNAGQPRT
jgi:hypothetical protein